MADLIIVGDGPEPQRLPVDREACLMVRTAESHVTGALEEALLHEPGYADQLLHVQRDLATHCGHACVQGCQINTFLRAERSGLELPFSEKDQAFCAAVLGMVLLEDSEAEELYGPNRHVIHLKRIVERRLEIYRQDHSPAPEDPPLPTITDAAYEVLASVAPAQYHICFTVLRQLFATSSAMQRDGLQEATSEHPVLLQDPTVIDGDEVLLVFTNPKFQETFYYQSTPRSQMFSAS